MLMIIACITMLIDHIGVHVLDIPAMRIIGRIAMPVYAYLMTGSFEHTHDKNAYLKRVLRIAIISQIPFMLMVDAVKLNICFTWFISLLVMLCLDNTKSKKTEKILMLLPLLLLSALIPMDYGIFAVNLVILFYVRSRMKGIRGNAVLIIGAVLNYFLYGVPMQFAGLSAIPIILLCEKYDLIRLKNKYAAQMYRIFVPAQ